MLRIRTALPGAVVGLGLLIATGAAAQPAATSSQRGEVSFSPDRLQVRLRYGVVQRSGAQTDATAELSYAGLTPNDVALSAWAWPLLDGQLGLAVSAGREAFGLYDGAARVTQGGLLRVSGGPTGRLGLGPAQLEALVGYQLQQLPLFDTSTGVTWGDAQRHGLLLAARALLDLGPVTVEGRFEYPLALAVSSPLSRPLASQGLSAGGALRVNLFVTGSMHWGLLADVTWLQDSVRTTDGSAAAAQQVLRAGLGVDLRWRDEVRKGPRLGALRLSVVDAEGGAPLAAQVELSSGADRRTAATDSTGAALVPGLLPGTVVARATVGGYEPAEAGAQVEPDGETPLVLRLTKEKPKVGTLLVTVTDKETGAAVAGVAVEAGGQSAVTSAKGEASLAGLAPGPLPVKLTAEGYQPAEEAASIVAGKTASVAVQLLSAKKRVPATISGQVRSARGGKPIAAVLELPEASIKTKADAKGAFAFRVPGGTYTVRISAPGYLAQTKSVTVRDGDQTIFNVDLFPR